VVHAQSNVAKVLKIEKRKSHSGQFIF